MKPRFRFLLAYFFCWIGVFFLLRTIFLFYEYNKTADLQGFTILLTYWHGLLMDASMAGYILLPVCLLVLLSVWIPFFSKAFIYRLYSGIVLFFTLLVSWCDLEIYKEWGFRIDSTPLKYLNTPREVVSSVSYLPLGWLFMSLMIFYLFLLSGFRFVFKYTFFREVVENKFLFAAGWLLFAAVLVIPIRGGIQQSPINQSSVYFSTNNYANHAAVNASWNFLYSILAHENDKKNPYNYFSRREDKRIADSLYTWLYFKEPLINFPGDTPTNVIVVIWESFTEKAIHLQKGGIAITPGFNRLKSEGVYFSNMYASGDRTNKGVPAILSGYPAMPNTSVIHSPSKSGKLNVLSRTFKDKGYSTPFFYGGEPEFANIKSYLLQGGFDPIVGKWDFDEKDMNSKWGAHDGVVMSRVFRDLDAIKKPFFATWLTLTSHEPFETPLPPVIPGEDLASRYFNTLHYTDQCLYELVEKCRSRPWWNHTVMIIVGDHGHPLPKTGKRADDFRIPMLWIGGALRKKGVIIDKVVSQLDIAATLAQQAGIDMRKFPFSKNILDKGPDWAFFTFNNGFGFVNASGRILYDNTGNRPISVEGAAGEKETAAGKALQQFTYQDYLDK